MNDATPSQRSHDLQSNSFFSASACPLPVNSYAGTNFSATPLMQYSSPVGLGPSLKI